MTGVNDVNLLDIVTISNNDLSSLCLDSMNIYSGMECDDNCFHGYKASALSSAC
jgi:hypothetical protein